MKNYKVRRVAGSGSDVRMAVAIPAAIARWYGWTVGDLIDIQPSGASCLVVVKQ